MQPCDTSQPMIVALGYAEDHFDPRAPGHLCRGRERWIEYDGMLSESDAVAPIYRVVISGAAFTDDSARDAKRGIPHSSLDLTTVLKAFLNEGPVMAYCEEGHPMCVPKSAVGQEPHTISRPGGPLRQWVCRWVMRCESTEQIREAIEAGADVLLSGATESKGPPPIQGTPSVPVEADAPPAVPAPIGEALLNALYLLTAFRIKGRPTRHFQPSALPDVLARAQSVILLHMDKHGPCAGIYSRDPIGAKERIDGLLSDKQPVLVVPFAIPPMLARWDRALWELRQDWDSAAFGEFPVPPSPDHQHRQAAARAEE